MKLGITRVQNAAICYIAIWATAPVLAYGLAYRLVAIFCFLVWLLLEMTKADGIVRRPTILMVLCVTYVGYTMMVEFFTDQDYPALVQEYLLLLFLVFVESRRKALHSLAPVFWIVLATLPVWLYRTYVGLGTLDPYIARRLSNSSEAARELASQGFGGYGLIYMSVLMVPVLLFLCLRGHRTSGRVFLTRRKIFLFGLVPLNLILSLALVMRAGYSLAVVSTLLAAIVVIGLKHKTIPHLYFALMSSCLAAVLAFSNLPAMLEAVEPIVRDTAYAPKVEDLLSTLQRDAEQGSVSGRIDRYEASISTFLNMPFTGSLTATRIGGHSALLDRFARYGLLVGLAFCYLLFNGLLRMMGSAGSEFGMVAGVFVVLVLVGISNTLPGQAGVALFIMLPVAWSMCGASHHALPSRVRWRANVHKRPMSWVGIDRRGGGV